MQRISWRGWRLLAAVVTVIGGLALATGAPAGASLATTRFVPVTPARVLDTRNDPGTPVPTGGSITLPLTGRAGIGSDATAVVLNVTATETTAAGFVTVWPAGSAMPLASNLNVERRGQTIANLVVVRLGSGGAVSLFTQTSMHLVADVAGYFAPAATSADGRFVPVETPTRLLDTRNGTGSLGKVGIGGTVTVDVGAAVGAGYGAAVLNITATEASAPGFVTAWPNGTAIPVVSNLNVETAGQTIANLAIVPLGADGKVALFSQTGTHLVADLVGVFTDATAPASDAGLFVPGDPTRVLDTRNGTGAPAAPVAAGNAATITFASGGAVLLNVTATNTRAAGYLTVWPNGAPLPVASNLNVARANQTIANLAISKLGSGSDVSIFSQTGADVVADQAGVFTPSTAITATPPAPATNAPPPASGTDRFHAVYALTSDASLLPIPGVQPDLRPDALVPKIRAELASVRAWYATQTGNRKPRFTLDANGIVVTVVTLPVTTAAIEQLSGNMYDQVVDLVRATGVLQDYEMGVIYLPTQGPQNVCGETAVDAVLYMKECENFFPTGTSFPFGSTYVAAHEMAHALGAVEACSPHYEGTGHVNDSPSDILYFGPQPRDFQNATLDVNHDDYYGTNIPGCPDMEDHPVWLPAGAG